MNPSKVITPPTDRELLRAASTALRESAEVHRAERIPFVDPLLALADAIDERLSRDRDPGMAIR